MKHLFLIFISFSVGSIVEAQSVTPGWQMIKEKRYEEAISFFDSLVNIHPTDSAYWGRGFAYSSIGKHQQAEKDYTKMIELDSTNAWDFCHLADEKCAVGDFSGALMAYNRCLQGTHKAIVYKFRSQAYMGLKQYKDALNDLDIAVSLEPDDGDYYYDRALAKQALGMDFCEDLRTAAKLKSSKAEKSLKQECP